jgi:glyceraldehyde 3-phosphate dehydrogenase
MKIAINGFGRIGRIFFRQVCENPDIEVVAINDLSDKENLLYLLKNDSVYRKFEFKSSSTPGFRASSKPGVLPDLDKVQFLQEKDPANLPWKDLGVDVVLESTGFFTTYEKAKAHLDAGAKRVVISAPAKDDDNDFGKTVLMGVNNEALGSCSISSNGSCTTNAASPIIQIMEEALDIEKALLDTVHGYTASQSLVDSPNAKSFRNGRAAAVNIVPASTGAATTVTKAVKGVPFFDGIAVRVPVPAGSFVDLTFVTKKDTSVEEVNDILRKAAKEERWQGIFAVTEDPLVSSDILGMPYGSIADLSLTRVAGGNLIKVLSWYDNEWGYCAMLIKHIETLKEYI